MATGALSLTSRTRPLGLRKRPDLIVERLEFSRRPHWTVKDPIALRYFQLREEEYFILGLLDGRASLTEICRRFERQFAPRRLEPAELQAFLAKLHESGLITSDGPQQSQALLSRAQEQRRRDFWQRVSNPLAIRFRGIDPEPLLAWLDARCGWIVSRWCAALALFVVVAAIIVAATNTEALVARLGDVGEFFTPGNLPWLALAILISKALHELGHALACRHFGGECHELGAMLFFFVPCLYCDVSDAWMVPGKWQRAAVGAAGVIVEITLAAVCTLLWWSSEPGLLNAICLNMMVVCSISTLIVNGNPLLRFDGYYVLSDLVEMPNLGDQSSAVARQWLARWFLGIDVVADRALAASGRGWLAAYAAASLAYRCLVIVLGIWVLRLALDPHGLAVAVDLLTIVAVGGLVGMPLWRASRWVRDPVWSRLVNKKQFVVRSIGLAVLFAGVLLVPLPHRIKGPVLIEPQGAKRVYASVSGRIGEHVEAGDVVHRGDVVAKLTNLELRRQVVQLEGQCQSQRRRLENFQSRAVQDPLAENEVPVAREMLAELEERLRLRKLDEERLVLTAPIDGTVLPPPMPARRPTNDGLPNRSGTPLEDQNTGMLVETGDVVCLVGDPRRLQAVVAVDQSMMEFALVGQRVKIQLDELPGEFLEGTITELAGLDLRIAPRELVAGGELPTHVDQQGIHRPLETLYQARVSLDDHTHRLRLGATGRAKIDAAPQTLALRLWRFLSSTFRFTK